MRGISWKRKGCSSMVSFEEPDNWRYERKFFISHADHYKVEHAVKMHPAVFTELFHQRDVNNIYFDTFTLTNFFKSVDGQSHRIKVRIRWYGELYGEIKKPVLELKIKNGLLGVCHRGGIPRRIIRVVFPHDHAPSSIRGGAPSRSSAIISVSRRIQTE